MSEIRVGIIGSTSALAKLIVLALQSMNIEFVSIGRRHHPDAAETIDWDITRDLSTHPRVELLFYLAFDHRTIKDKSKYFYNNLTILEKLVSSPENRSKFVIPLSLSGRIDSPSRYGKVKFAQEVLAKENSLKTILVGWANIEENGGKQVQNLMRLLRRVRLNILPDGGSQELKITELPDIIRALTELLDGKTSVRGFGNSNSNLRTLVYGDLRVVSFGFGSILKLILKISPFFYILIPPRFIKMIDSARSIAI